MPAKKKANTKPLTGAALVKEVCRRFDIRYGKDAGNKVTQCVFKKFL